MSINNLLVVLTPPATPNEAGAGKQWPMIDGMFFPSDYVEFINVYGSGRIADFLIVFNPFSQNEDINFFDQFRLVLGSFNDLVASDSEYFKYPLYPVENGLIPVGVTDNGDCIFWVVTSKQNSDEWHVAIIASRSPEIEYFKDNLTAVLEGLLIGRLSSSSLPSGFASAGIRFDII
ncbi:SMI1/KNR4 family protein [Pseudomonas sp. SG-MS2]|jgi:hypothetical protein|uniref:SMI1/KNR4 family protein n=2 Tax=Pseudomonas putida TaxID=303 RepID=A0A7Y7ZBD0_PSEPU|nr:MULTISPECIES: SMI1/KNR4 family protein [Pseudomonas]KAF1309261.1 SMI1/KNR4 family protein [Pseudomonas sp. SG-MS2]NWC81776.1 SMI1/KNR4 family protein [Pseudomonas putida]QQE86513.1 SMI1/KNR4 family protein [Pseudomonas putida]